MASSGSFAVTTDNSHVVGSINWSSINNNSENTSSVTATMYLSRNNTGYTTYGSGVFNITINGVTLSNSSSFTITYNSNTVMVTGTVIVPHNDDGTKSITISWSGGGSNSPFSIVASSGTATLDSIPRASSFTSATYNWIFPSDFTMAINRASTSFTHKIEIHVYNSYSNSYYLVKTISNITATSNISSAFSTSEKDKILELLNYDTTNFDQAVVVRLYTYNSSTQTSANQVGSYYDSTGKCSSPSETTLTVSNFNLGTSASYNFSDTTYYYDLTASIGNYTKTFLTKATVSTTAFAWNTSVTSDQNSLLDNLPSKTGTITWKLTSYSLNNGIYRKIKNTSSKTCTITIPTSIGNPVWTGGVTITDTNSKVSALTGAISTSGYIISGLSKLDVALKTSVATATRGTTIKQYNIAINGATKTLSGTAVVGNKVTFTETELKSKTNQSMTFSVTDNRGFTTSLTSVPFTVIQYSQPVINATALRDNGYYDSTTLTLSGTFSSISVGGTEKNSIVTTTGMQYQTKNETDSGSYSGSINFVNDTSKTGFNYGGQSVTITLLNTKQWKVKFLVTDKIATYSFEITVPVGLPIMFMDSDKRSIGINKFPSGNGTFEISGDTYIDGLTYASQGVISNHVSTGKGNSGLLCIARLTIIDLYANAPMTFSIVQRGKTTQSTISLKFSNVSTTDPTVESFTFSGSVGAYLVKVSTGVWDLYVEKTEAYDEITTTMSTTPYLKNKVSVTYPNTFVSSITPTNTAISTDIAYDTNYNGEWIKFPDGTMICTYNVIVTDQSIGSSYGSLYQGTRTWIFPVPFLTGTTPTVTCGRFQWGTFGGWGAVGGSPTNTSVLLRGYDVVSRATGTNCYINATAIGRWK